MEIDNKKAQELMQLAKNPHYTMSPKQQEELEALRNQQVITPAEEKAADPNAKNVKNKNVVNKHSRKIDMHKPGMDTVQPEQHTMTGRANT